MKYLDFKREIYEQYICIYIYINICQYICTYILWHNNINFREDPNKYMTLLFWLSRSGTKDIMEAMSISTFRSVFNMSLLQKEMGILREVGIMIGSRTWQTVTYKIGRKHLIVTKNKEHNKYSTAMHYSEFPRDRVDV